MESAGETSTSGGKLSKYTKNINTYSEKVIECGLRPQNSRQNGKKVDTVKNDNFLERATDTEWKQPILALYIDKSTAIT